MQKYLVGVLFLLSLDLAAQDKKRFTVNPGEKVFEKIPREEMYRYPQFQLADIAFKNGTWLRSWVNYNSLFGEMQFIDPNRDTLSIADEANIRWIAIEQDSFYFDESWMELLVSHDKMKLLRKKRIEISNKEKIGGMDIAGFGAIETNTKYTGSQHMKDVVAREKLTYAENITYYFGDRFNHFFPATKKQVLKIYNKKQKLIERYLDENKIDFLKESDLKKLLEYLQHI